MIAQNTIQRFPQAQDLVGLDGDVRGLALGAADPDAVHPLLPRAAAEEVTGALPCKWCDLRGACRIEERCPTPAVAVQLDKIVNAREVTG